MPPFVCIKKAGKEVFTGVTAKHFMETTDKGWESLVHPGEIEAICEAKQNGTYLNDELRCLMYDPKTEKFEFLVAFCDEDDDEWVSVNDIKEHGFEIEMIGFS